MEYSSRYLRYRAWASCLPTYAAGRETIKFWNDIVFAGYSRNNGLDIVESSNGDDFMQELTSVAAAEEAANDLELAMRNAEGTGEGSGTGANAGVVGV